MKQSYNLLFFGSNQDNILPVVSQLIYQLSGSFQASEFSTLSSDFAGIITFEMETAQVPRLLNSIQEISDKLTFKFVEKKLYQKDTSQKKKITIWGPDRIGINIQLMNSLSNHNIEISQMNSYSEQVNNLNVFTAHLFVQITDKNSLSILSKELDEIVEELGEGAGYYY